MAPRRSKSGGCLSLQSSAPSVGVSIRVRPPEPRSRASATQCCKGEFGEVEVDFVHEEHANQEDVYQESFRPIINAFLQGIDCTVLIYGGSHTGKSYTLEGVGGYGGGREGAIPRAVGSIFRHLAMIPEDRFKLYATYSALTVGHEALLVDLLSPGSSVQSLRETSSPVALSRLSDFHIQCPDDIYEVLRRGRVTRAMGLSNWTCNESRCTANLGSGAVHTMLTLQLEGRGCCRSAKKCDGSQIGRISFVELAGPESKESCECADGRYTRSLAIAYSALTGVLLGMAKSGNASPRSCDGSRSFSHIPWRDSPLTRWMKESLITSSMIWVVSTVSSAPDAAADTLSALNYVQRLRNSRASEGVVVTPTWETRCPACWQISASDFSGSVPLATSPKSDLLHPKSKCCACLCSSNAPHAAAIQRLTFVPKNNLAFAMLSGSQPAMGADTAAYSELLAIIKRSGGGLRAEALLEKMLQEMGELRGRLATEKDEAKRLKSNVRTLVDERRHDELELETNLGTIAALRNELATTQDEVDEQRTRKEEAQRRAADRQERIGELERENEDLRTTKDNLSHKLQVQIHDLSDEAQRLKTKASDAITKAQTEKGIRKAQELELHRLKEQVLEGDRLREECHDFRRALETVRQERGRLQDEKWEADERLERLNVELEASRLALDKLDAENQGFKERVDFLEEDLRSVRTRNELLRNDMASMDTQLEEHKRRGADADTLGAVFRETKALMAEVEVQAQRYGCFLTDLRSSTRSHVQNPENVDGNLEEEPVHSVQQWRRVLNAIVGALDTAERAANCNLLKYEDTSKRCAIAEESSSQLSSRLTFLEEQLADSRTLVDSMRQELESLREAERMNTIDLKIKEDALRDMRSERDALLDKVKVLQDKVTELLAKCEHLEAEVGNAATAERELRLETSDRKRELEDFQKRLDWSQSSLHEEHQKVLRLQNDIELLERAEDDKRGQLASVREERRRLEEDLRLVKDQLAKVKKEKADVEVKMETADRKIERIEDKLKTNAALATEKLDELSAEHAREESRYRADVEIFKTQHSELEIRCSELANENGELRVTVEDLEDDKRRLRKEINENKVTMESQRKLQEDLAATVAEREQLLQEMASSKEEIKSLTSHSAKLTRENDELGHTLALLKRQVEQGRLDSMVMAAKQARTQEALRQQRRENMLQRTLTTRPSMEFGASLSARTTSLGVGLERGTSSTLATLKPALRTGQSGMSTPTRTVSDVTLALQRQPSNGAEQQTFVPTVSRVSSAASEVLAEIGEKLKAEKSI